MLIECRFLFILHPVRLYPLTKQYERKNVAESVGTQFSCNGQIFTSQLVFYFLSSCPERCFIQRGLIGITGTEYLAIHHLEGRLKILRSQLLVSSRRMVLLQTIIWYSTSRPFQQVSYFKSSQSSQNVSTLPTILLIFFLTVLWWNKLR